METFVFFLKEGLWHITDLAGYDHILFVSALSLSYRLEQWRILVYLITAFTLGHSLALAAATLNWVSVDSALIEFLIPLSILLTVLHNLWQGGKTRISGGLYGLAAIFGLIHGLGFSNYLRFILGQEESLFLPLLSFNIGLELGQLLILFPVVLLGAAWQRFLPQRYWIWSISAIIGALALHLCIERWGELWGAG